LSTQQEQLYLQAYSELCISPQCEKMKKEGELLNIKIRQVILDYVLCYFFYCYELYNYIKILQTKTNGKVTCGQKRMKRMQVSFLSEVILIPTNLVHC